MVLKFSEYVLFLIAFCMLPDQLFTILLREIEHLKCQLKNFYEKLPFQTIISSGNKLLLTLSELEGSFSCGIIGMANKSNSLPQFKFYTSLLLKLLETNRQEGISIRKIIPELRQGVQRDIQFEKKISKVVLGGNFQFLVITIATWGFVYLSQQLIEIKLDRTLGCLMVILQILGFIALYFATSFMKKNKFIAFSSAFEELYLFRALVEVRLPIKVILSESKILSGSLVSSKVFNTLSRRLTYSVERWKSSGVSPREESDELINEVWYLQEEQFLDFIKKLEVLKFVIMALLFLPAYFIYLAAIFKFFMEQ